MTPALQAVIDEAYRVFADYRIGSDLVVCRCIVCMTHEVERALVQTPLREIHSGLLAEYTNSAHGWGERIADEMRYFLPRYFELIAQGDPPDALGMDACLRRLKEADWRLKWPEAEAAVIARFFGELLIAGLLHLDLVRWPVGWRLSHDIGNVLSLAVTAGGDIGQLLSVWDRAADPGAAVHMAALRPQVYKDSAGDYWSCAHLEDHRTAAGEIAAFLTGPKADARIEAAFFSVEDERLQQILSDSL